MEQQLYLKYQDTQLQIKVFLAKQKLKLNGVALDEELDIFGEHKTREQVRAEEKERRIAERLNTRAIGYGRINTESVDRENLLRYLLPQDIMPRYDERIYSRICNERYAKYFLIEGDDLRLTK